jgi:hypothetical protein
MDLGALAWIERSNMIENENDIPAFTGGGNMSVQWNNPSCNMYLFSGIILHVTCICSVE